MGNGCDNYEQANGLSLFGIIMLCRAMIGKAYLVASRSRISTRSRLHSLRLSCLRAIPPIVSQFVTRARYRARNSSPLSPPDERVRRSSLARLEEFPPRYRSH